MTEKRYRQIAFILLALFCIGLCLTVCEIEFGPYLLTVVFCGFIIFALHFVLIGFWEID